MHEALAEQIQHFSRKDSLLFGTCCLYVLMLDSECTSVWLCVICLQVSLWFNIQLQQEVKKKFLFHAGMQLFYNCYNHKDNTFTYIFS